MSGRLFDDAIEASYWIFDAQFRRTGAAERDAFKTALRRLTVVELIDRVQDLLEIRAETALDHESMAEHDLYQEAVELLHETLRTVERAQKAALAEGPWQNRDGTTP